MARAGAGTMASYGRDEITDRVRTRCRELFETDVEIFPVVSGTAGNALAIAAMTPPDGVVLCHADAHIERDEDGAPAFFTGGARTITIEGEDGKLHPEGVLSRGGWASRPPEGTPFPPPPTGGLEAHPPRGAPTLSLTNATETGTVYTAAEMRALTSLGDFGVHLDGARFANAVASLDCSPAEITWRAGVDVLVFGGTKNGLINAELIVVFRKELARDLAARCHRSGHRPAKMRFISAQFEAYLTDDLWLRNARHANAMARRLADGFKTIHPVQVNVVFTRLEKDVAAALQEQGFAFFDWPIDGDDAYRFVTGFQTSEADVDALVEAYGGLGGFADRCRPGG